MSFFQKGGGIPIFIYIRGRAEGRTIGQATPIAGDTTKRRGEKIARREANKTIGQRGERVRERENERAKE